MTPTAPAARTRGGGVRRWRPRYFALLLVALAALLLAVVVYTSVLIVLRPAS